MNEGAGVCLFLTQCYFQAEYCITLVYQVSHSFPSDKLVISLLAFWWTFIQKNKKNIAYIYKKKRDLESVG